MPRFNRTQDLELLEIGGVVGSWRTLAHVGVLADGTFYGGFWVAAVTLMDAGRRLEFMGCATKPLTPGDAVEIARFTLAVSNGKTLFARVSESNQEGISWVNSFGFVEAHRAGGLVLYELDKEKVKRKWLS